MKKITKKERKAALRANRLLKGIKHAVKGVLIQHSDRDYVGANPVFNMSLSAAFKGAAGIPFHRVWV